jgi:hypothetical protein
MSNHMFVTSITLGLAEFFHPAFIGENEARFFKVDYDSTGKARGIESSCESTERQGWEPYMKYGWHACVNTFIGL